jgi:uncharacterized repeat protein (TIGR02543 family)
MRKLVLFFVVVSMFVFFGCEIEAPVPEPTYYTIAYFGNGNDLGSAPADTRRYEAGSSATVLDKGSLAKTSHTFLYWNTSPQGSGASYNPNETITLTSNISLYAIWGSLYTVSFDTDGGSAISAISGIAAGAKISKPDDPTKPGYSFGGWYKDKQYSALWDFTTDVVAGNMTLCAKWEKIILVYPYEVSDVSHTSIGYYTVVSWTNPDDDSFSHVRIIPAEFEWADSNMLDKEPGITSYSMLDYAGSEYIIIKSIDKNGNISNGVTYFFTSNETPEKYTVAFYRNWTADDSEIISIQGEQDEQILFPEQEEFTKRDGYTLVGWNTVRDGTGTAYFVYDDMLFGNNQRGHLNFTDEPIVLGQENIELYAIWTDFHLGMYNADGASGFEIMGYRGLNKDIVIPGKINTWPVTCVGGWAFYDKNITSVVIPNSVTSISDAAFYDNKLTRVTIPNSVKYINGGAFWENDLIEIIIGNNVGLVPTLHDGPDAFEEFIEFYDTTGKKAGKYYINNGAWTVQYQ